MNTTLSNEVYWLVLTLFMTALFWVPYILNRMLEQGVWNALRDPQGGTGTARPWARRMMKAHDNAVENLVIFAPLVILVELTGANSRTTAAACLVYFLARLVHYLVFTFAVPVLRVAAFLTGFGAQVVLLLAVLGTG